MPGKRSAKNEPKIIIRQGFIDNAHKTGPEIATIIPHAEI